MRNAYQAFLGKCLCLLTSMCWAAMQVADSVAKQILNYGRTHGSWNSTKAVKPRVA